ncbi:hypothetical protein BT96DRAFT_935746 [Gymnopus androsaceus JB14]|uniref:Uncharacterized protein n=1 Tax=Gymnopus androsaceus JB14 TaxID=1447944 RepID=A0A6A4I5M3_9AGAR|nr:hypothetical protein BT96DRAFT_935746 [Gymnopus androsaceus JB14]
MPWNSQYPPPSVQLPLSRLSARSPQSHDWLINQGPQWSLNTLLFGLGLITTIGGYKSSSVAVTVTGVLAVLLSFILFILSKLSESRTSSDSFRLQQLEEQLDRINIEMVTVQNIATSLRSPASGADDRLQEVEEQLARMLADTVALRNLAEWLRPSSLTSEALQPSLVSDGFSQRSHPTISTSLSPSSRLSPSSSPRSGTPDDYLQEVEEQLVRMASEMATVRNVAESLRPPSPFSGGASTVTTALSNTVRSSLTPDSSSISPPFLPSPRSFPRSGTPDDDLQEVEEQLAPMTTKVASLRPPSPFSEAYMAYIAFNNTTEMDIADSHGTSIPFSGTSITTDTEDDCSAPNADHQQSHGLPTISSIISTNDTKARITFNDTVQPSVVPDHLSAISTNMSPSVQAVAVLPLSLPDIISSTTKIPIEA